jgi:hypothetical protein
MSADTAVKPMILDPAGPFGRTGERSAHVAVAEPAGRIRVDLVAPGHARDLLAGEQDDVKDRGRQPDQAFDPALQSKLTGSAMCHGARL